ncbi:MAG TPA: hypothetical protein VEN78_38115 [Bradyrhizobium sp.]|nr:hypothetical protein [Bradyrhizobium sp.]
MTRATELPLQIYFVPRRSPFIDIVIVHNQDDVVAGLLDIRDGFSLRDCFTFVALRRFNPDLAHCAGSLFQRSSRLDRLLSSSYAGAIIGLIAPAFKQFV